MNVREIESDHATVHGEVLATVQQSAALDPFLDWCTLVAWMFIVALVCLDSFPGVSDR